MLVLTVCITYKPAKAAHMVHLHNCAGTGFAPALRSDLDHFKLPHPKIANVNQVTSSGIEFSYRTFDGSTLFFNVLRTFEKREGPYSKRIFKMKNNPEIEGLKAKLAIEEMTLDEIEEWRVLPVDGRDTNRSRSPPPRRAEYRAPSPYRRPSWTDSARRPFARSRYNRSPDKRSLDRCSPSWTDSPRRQLARYSRSPSADRRSPDRLPSWTDLPQKPLARYNRSLSTDRRTPAHDLTIATRMSVSGYRFKETRSQHPAAAGDSDLDLEYYGPPPPPPAINENTSSIVARLTHEYWDTRRDMANAAVRGVLLGNQLRTLGASAFSEEEQTSDLDVAEQVRRMELEVEEERVRLTTAEDILADVLRECEMPMVVPELLKIVQLWEECDSPMSDD